MHIRTTQQRITNSQPQPIPHNLLGKRPRFSHEPKSSPCLRGKEVAFPWLVGVEMRTYIRFDLAGVFCAQEVADDDTSGELECVDELI
jgi:hypothetical protein